jgi:hypothetical protein
MSVSMDRFNRRRPFRHIVPYPPGINDYCGPDVSQTSWCHFLNGTDWFEVKQTSIQQCIDDDVIPCMVGGDNELIECNRLEWPIAFLPNSVFFDSGSRWKNSAYFRSPWVYSILLLNDEDLNAGWQLTNSKFRGAISRVRHFLRPTIYDAAFYDGPQLWDVFLFYKSRDFNMDAIAQRWPRFTTVQNGYFTYEELRYKAQRSRFCIVGSAWDTYGVAAHEIMAEGCPALVCDPGTLPGNVDIGRQALYLKNEPDPQRMGSDVRELEAAACEVLKWNRRDVREATLQWADPAVLREQWRQAMFGLHPDQRTKALPKPTVYCFAQNRYVPRLEARCVQEDLAHFDPT